MAIADDRAKAVELALAQIEKQFGKGSIVRLGSKEALVPIAVISTGSISFDAALGVGGIPRGRVTEVFGPESSGKTTITLQIIAEAHKLGRLAAFVDAEHALDPAYARKLGVDIDNLLVSQPDSGEQALEITEALVRSGAIDVLVDETTSLEIIGALTVRVMLPLTPESVPVIFAVPCVRVVTAPAAETVATLASDEVQATLAVRSLLVPSLYTPVAVSWSARPAATEDVVRVILIDVKLA